MLKLKSEDCFKIAGRGTVFTFKNKEPFWSKEVLNQTVEIDGHEYTVTGIEMFGKHRDTGEKGYLYGIGEAIGLLVRGEKK